MVSIVSAVRDIARVREVSAVLVRHGFGEIVSRIGIGAKKKSSAQTQDPREPGDEQASAGAHGPPATGKAARPPLSLAERIRRVLEELGPSFVKLGQLASTRTDLLPPSLLEELQKLQDSAPLLPFEEVKSQIELSLGTALEEAFETFEEKPLAAASIAQVHRAQLKHQDKVLDVAVKVQRPKIAATIASDVEILHTLAALLERAVPETRIYSPIGLIQQFDQAITAELDFVSEADNARRFAQNFDQVADIQFPQVYRHVSGKQVLTMEYMPGVKINQAVARGYDGSLISRRAFAAMIKQIYEDGFFHADPHPGNVLIAGDQDAPVISFIDLGMVGRLSPRMRDLTVDVVMACLRRDHEGIADALYAIGTPTKKIDIDAYNAEVALLAEKYLGKPLRELEISAMIRDLVRGGTKFGIEIPTDFLLMGKALMTIEGIGKELDPQFDVYEESRPLFSDLLRKRYSPEKMGNELLRRLERLGGAGYKVPQQVQEVLDDLRFGRLSIQTEDKARTAAAEVLSLRLFAALLAGFQILASALLLSVGRDRLGASFLLTTAVTLGAMGVIELWRLARRR